MYVRDFVNREATSLLPEMTLLEAAAALNQINVDGLSVVDATGALVGIFTKNHLVEAVTKFFSCTIHSRLRKCNRIAGFICMP